MTSDRHDASDARPAEPAARLVRVVADVGRHLPAAHAAVLARTLARHPAPSALARGEVADAVPTLPYRQAASAVLAAWAEAPSTPGPALATAVLAAADAAAAVRAEQTVEIVWTGPVTDQVPVRRTRQVLLDVIHDARTRLFLVSFAAYNVPVVVEALAGAAARGVRVDLVLETASASGGRLTVDAAAAFAEVTEAVSFYAWPAVLRPAHGTGRASLHAKAAVADGDTALVTSANLTASAIEANVELGLLVRGGPVPRRLDRHLARLIDDQVLQVVHPVRG